MEEISQENLNAIKVHLTIKDMATRAIRLNLVAEIRQRCTTEAPKSFLDPPVSMENCVSEFLSKHYTTLIHTYASRRHMPHYVLDFVKTLNPSFPTRMRDANAPFPNDLELFDVGACYQLAKALLLIQYPDLQCYEDLILIRNEFYGHLNFLKLKNKQFESNMEKLREIVGKLVNQNSDLRVKDELVNRIEMIYSIKTSDELQANDMKSYVDFFKANRFRFFYSTIPVLEKKTLKNI